MRPVCFRQASFWRQECACAESKLAYSLRVIVQLSLPVFHWPLLCLSSCFSCVTSTVLSSSPPAPSFFYLRLIEQPVGAQVRRLTHRGQKTFRDHQILKMVAGARWCDSGTEEAVAALLSGSNRKQTIKKWDIWDADLSAGPTCNERSRMSWKVSRRRDWCADTRVRNVILAHTCTNSQHTGGGVCSQQGQRQTSQTRRPRM